MRTKFFLVVLGGLAWFPIACGDETGVAKDAGTIGEGAHDGGSGVAPKCEASETPCGNSCVLPDSDPRHCGGCGQACKLGEVCSSGHCATHCPVYLVDCDGACIDPSESRSHCGASATCTGDRAGTRCPSGSVCSDGKCALSCQSELLECDGLCIDPKSDATHCGASGDCRGVASDGGADGTRGASCASGEVCSNGACMLSCQSGRVACAGECIDPTSDGQFCGATPGCGAVGGSAGAICSQGERCVSGHCELSCPAGQIACGSQCIDPDTDNTFCGAALDCFGTNAGTSCAAGKICSGAGTCETTCAAGLVRCGDSCVDPATDRVHCGASGNCSGANAGSSCAPGELCDGQGVCALTCSVGLVACDGVCIDPQTADTHCGASSDCAGANAGATCDSSQVCSSGSCVARCSGGAVFCDGRCIDPLTDRLNCGASSDCNGNNAGSACTPNEVCNGAGVCAKTCAGGLVRCGSQCLPAGVCAPCGTGGVCDPNDLGAATCTSIGMGSGLLACDPSTCMYDTSMCTGTPDGGGGGGTGG